MEDTRDLYSQATFSPYPLVPGGGERYILGAARTLSDFGASALITPDPYSSLRLDNVMFDLGFPVGEVGTIPASAAKKHRLERCVVMGNEIYPSVYLSAERNFFHCQFPFPLAQESQDRISAGLESLSKYERVLVNSEFTRQAYLSQITEFGYSAVVDVLNPPVATARLLHLQRRPKPWIISVGRFSAAGHSKRQDVLIEAMKATSTEFRREWTLFLCGTVPNNSADRAYFKQLQESVGSEINVEFVLAPSTELLDSILSQSQIYAHACGFGVTKSEDYWKCEHFGITIVEAIVAGCQVICYSVGGGREILEKVGSGATFETVEELAAKLEDRSSQFVDFPTRQRASEFFGDGAFRERLTNLVR
jgi:glycosyltransferase involved in cell wall biosynthesis